MNTLKSVACATLFLSFVMSPVNAKSIWDQIGETAPLQPVFEDLEKTAPLQQTFEDLQMTAPVRSTVKPVPASEF